VNIESDEAATYYVEFFGNDGCTTEQQSGEGSGDGTCLPPPDSFRSLYLDYE
jgi:hypothetical protein